jgi:hypothetical protein
MNSTVRTEPSQVAVALAGHLGVHRELLVALDEQPGLLALIADPWSGCSALLGSVVEDLANPTVIIDARTATDMLDLARWIAYGAVRRFRPAAQSYWRDQRAHVDPEALALHRILSDSGIDLADLRHGTGPSLQRLGDALELLIALAESPVCLVIDHTDLLLNDLQPRKQRESTGVLRAALQRHPQLQLVLVGWPGSAVEDAIDHPEDPLYRSGQKIRLRRPSPAQYVDDMVVLRPEFNGSVDLLGAAAELAGGVPWITWKVIELADSTGSVPQRAVGGWTRLRELTAPVTARQFDTLRRTHPIAQQVVTALARGDPAYAVPANSKRITDALGRLRDIGLAWQPSPRKWSLSDPLLAAWARDNTS